MPGKKAVFGKKTLWKSLQFPFMNYTENLLNTTTQYLYSPRFVCIPHFPFSESLT